MAERTKELIVSELAERFESIGRCGCVIVGYKGLKGVDCAQVRRVIAAQGARMNVVRNKLFAISLEQLGAGGIRDILDGPSAVISGGDPMQAAKAAQEARKSCPLLAVLGGYAEGQVLDAAGVERLANLPGRDVLLSRALSCFCAPAQRLAGALAASAQRLASVLDSIRQKKQQAEQAG